MSYWKQKRGRSGTPRRSSSTSSNASPSGESSPSFRSASSTKNRAPGWCRVNDSQITRACPRQFFDTTVQAASPGELSMKPLPRLSAEAAKEAADGTIGLQQPPCPIHALHSPQPFLRLTQQRLELANTASQPAEAPELHLEVLAVPE